MKPEHRFHSYVTAATVTVMYFVIQHLLPLVSLNPDLLPFDEALREARHDSA
jgi:hypothetical protein